MNENVGWDVPFSISIKSLEISVARHSSLAIQCGECDCTSLSYVTACIIQFDGEYELSISFNHLTFDNHVCSLTISHWLWFMCSWYATIQIQRKQYQHQAKCMNALPYEWNRTDNTRSHNTWPSNRSAHTPQSTIHTDTYRTENVSNYFVCVWMIYFYGKWCLRPIGHFTIFPEFCFGFDFSAIDEEAILAIFGHWKRFNILLTSSPLSFGAFRLEHDCSLLGEWGLVASHHRMWQCCQEPKI